MKLRYIAIAATVCLSSSALARQPSPLSCSFVNSNAYNNKADCMFIDHAHTNVLVTPHRKISAKTAADWIVSTSIALQIGGEKRFNTITVLTGPNGELEYAEATSTGEFSILHEPAVIKKLTKICKRPNDWSDVIGPDNAPATKHKCRPPK